MRIGIRADGGQGAGMGHLGRCMALLGRLLVPNGGLLGILGHHLAADEIVTQRELGVDQPLLGSLHAVFERQQGLPGIEQA